MDKSTEQNINIFEMRPPIYISLWFGLAFIIIIALYFSGFFSGASGRSAILDSPFAIPFLTLIAIYYCVSLPFQRISLDSAALIYTNLMSRKNILVSRINYISVGGGFWSGRSYGPSVNFYESDSGNKLLSLSINDFQKNGMKALIKQLVTINNKIVLSEQVENFIGGKQFRPKMFKNS